MRNSISLGIGVLLATAAFFGESANMGHAMNTNADSRGKKVLIYGCPQAGTVDLSAAICTAMEANLARLAQDYKLIRDDASSLRSGVRIDLVIEDITPHSVTAHLTHTTIRTGETLTLPTARFDVQDKELSASMIGRFVDALFSAAELPFY